MKKLLIEIEVGEGFKNYGEAFDFLHKELPCFNFEMGGPIGVSRNQNVEQTQGTIIGKWGVHEQAGKTLADFANSGKVFKRPHHALVFAFMETSGFLKEFDVEEGNPTLARLTAEDLTATDWQEVTE